MNFDEIMTEIKSGLSGKPEEDIVYLRSQCEKYRNHTYSKEISRAIGRMIYELLPDDKKEEIASAMKQDTLGINTTLQEVDFCVYKRNFKKAESLLKELISKIEEANLFEDDTESEYHDFDEYYEEVLYRHLYHPEKSLRNTSIPLKYIYLQYGSILVELEKYEEAETALKKALRWNPVGADAIFEYLDLIKRLGRVDEFFQESLKSFRIAFRPEQLARCYRDIAYYFVEKKMWLEAATCNMFSLNFDDKKKQFVQSELYYIQTQLDADVETLSQEEFDALAEKYGFPVGADQDVIGLAYSLGLKFAEHKQYNIARYLYEIAYGLTEMEEIKELLDGLPEEE